MGPLTTATITAIATEVVKKATITVLDGLWRTELEPAKQLLQQLLDGYAREQFANRYIINILKMRTLHSPDSDVYLDDIYTPLRMRSLNDKNGNYELRVKDGKTIEHSGIVNIIGIAGQGKSTVMRKLFWEELRNSKRIPFFIELRKVETTILEHFKDLLRSLGLMYKDGDVELLLQSKKIVLMLDGFDEVKFEKRDSLLKEIINTLHVRFQCPILSSSRPDTEICRETGVNSYLIQPLEIEEICFLLEKLNVQKNTNELSTLVRENRYLQEILVTPILVNLLFVCYPYLDSVPESVSDFYSKLFMTLFQRHDKIKNYTRERKSNCTDDQVYSIFNSFSFNSLNRGESDFSSHSLNRYVKSSLQVEGLNKIDPVLVWSDIIDITCLLQQDGYDKYLFLHKSIQEFHAAQFISDCRYERKKSIYSQILAKIDADQRWDNVINFLSKIDESDFTELFLMKKCESIDLNHIQKNKEIVLENAISNILDKKTITFSYEISTGSVKYLRSDLIQSNTFLSSLNLLRYGKRQFSNKLEKPLDDAVRLSSEIIAGVRGHIDPEDFIDKLISLSIRDISNKNMQRIDIYIKDFIHLQEKYQELESLLLKELLSYYNEFYLPKKEALIKKEEILDLEFKIY